MANLKVSEQAYPSTRYTEGAAPSTPAASEAIIYAKADGLMYSKDDAGVETLMSSGAASGAVATDAIWDAAGDLVQGTGANTSAKLSAGTAGKVLTSNGAAAALTWETPSSGGTVLLGFKFYATTTTANTTSATLADADATNLAVAFTAPASGNVLVRLTGVARQPASVGVGARAYWGLRESTSIIAGPQFMLYAVASPGGAVLQTTSAAFYLTGVSAGSHTYKWAIAGDGSYGGGMYCDSTNFAIMEVWGLS